jgi:hypothetical protein
MKNKFLCSLLFITVIIQFAVKAQDGPFSTQYSYSPFTIDGKKMNIQQMDATLTLPVFHKMKKDSQLDFLLAGVEYNRLSLSGTGSQFGGNNFTSISLPLTFQKSFSPKYSLTGTIIPTLSSDLKDISGEDMLYSAAVMFNIRKSPTFSYSFGAAYSRQFFGNVLIPIIGIDWKIGDRWTLSGTLPVSEKVNYKLSDKSAVGVDADFSIGGGSYRLSKKLGSDYLQVQQLRSNLYYEYSPFKKFSIKASVGYNFSQKLDRYTKDQKVDWVPYNDLNKRVPSAELSKPGIAFQTGISYSF